MCLIDSGGGGPWRRSPTLLPRGQLRSPLPGIGRLPCVGPGGYGSTPAPAPALSRPEFTNAHEAGAELVKGCTYRTILLASYPTTVSDVMTCEFL